VSVVERWMPNALVFAIILTSVLGLAALGLTDSGPAGVIRGWGDGLARLLDFIAQIAIVLGYTLAHKGPVERLLTRIASFSLLAIAGLTVRDIMGYTPITLFVSGAVMLATLLLVGFA